MVEGKVVVIQRLPDAIPEARGVRSAIDGAIGIPALAMADDSPAPAQAPPLAANVHDTPQHEDTISRQELVSRARSFLTSPQVSHEDVFAKRRFLVDKGLTEPEINGLLSELVSTIYTALFYVLKYVQPPPLPVVPPRTYPQPPPSNLPNLLVGVARILTWAAGGTAAFLAIYFVSHALAGSSALLTALSAIHPPAADANIPSTSRPANPPKGST